MFEKATRLKLRFSTSKGQLTTEDLWDLSLDNLNSLAKSLNKVLKSEDEEDFLGDSSKKDFVTKLKFDIVLHILKVKKDEVEKQQKSVEDSRYNQQILELIANKQNQELAGKSVDELKSMLRT